MIIEVRKDELPIPVVIRDNKGNYEVLEMVAAGAKKLSARLGDAPESTKAEVRRKLGE